MCSSDLLAQGLTSALLVHLTGGRIETHFHVFGSLAILAVYRDWKVLVVNSLVIVADHFYRGIYWPYSVYGVASASPWRFLEHAGWVVFEDFFLIIASVRSLQEMREIAERQARTEETRDLVELKVAERTADLLLSQQHLRASEAKIRAILNAEIGRAHV